MSNEQKPLSITQPQEWIDALVKQYAPESEDVDLAIQNMGLHIAALEQRLAAAEADLSRLNVVADTVCHDPQGIGPSAVMFKQCKRIAELERELADARKGLRNCLLLASKHAYRGDGWAEHIRRFCAEAGITQSPLRDAAMLAEREK